MKNNYSHKEVEKKWQKYWADNKTFYFNSNDEREKFYMLPMFLYPSGEMHLGHLRNFSISDVIARYKRLQGYNVLHPTGADAFGLPAENAAIKKGIHPSEWTYKNLDKIMQSMLACGLSFDTSRTFATCDSEYYGFQQKIFIDLFKHGLAFQKESFVNWDPVDQTVLANEQVIDGRGWRSDALVEKKKLNQWFFKITKYAEELLNCIKNGELNGWPEKVRLMQENWIGKSEGAMINFKIAPSPLRGRGWELGVASSRKYSENTLKIAKNLRQKDNLAEDILWKFLRNKNLENLNFKREAPIDKYIVDFVCCETKVVIEVDGKIHDLQEVQKNDIERQNNIEKLGYKFLRVNAKDVIENTFEILDKIVNFTKRTPNPCTPSSQEGMESIFVYTTRPDTLFGASFIGISPNHPLAEELAKNNKEIASFIEDCKKAPTDEGSLETMEKKGVATGIYVEHPFDKDWKLPIWIANFILMEYGTGAIFAAPAHDERDFEFATKYNLPIKRVVCSSSDNISLALNKGDLPTPLIREDKGGALATKNILKNSSQELHETNYVLNYTDNFFPSTAKIKVSHLNYNPLLIEKAKKLIANETLFEKEIWCKILSSFKDLKWTRQKPIGEYIVDFYCAELMLAIEIDRESHISKEEFESNRINRLNEVGVNILRYSNSEIKNNIEGIFDDLKNKILFLRNENNSLDQGTPPYQGGDSGLPYTEEGFSINSDFLNGLSTKEAKSKIIEKIEEMNIGERKINYRLRDWGVSRQRYWGCPIPIIHCDHCGIVSEKEENLPIKLPEDVIFDGKGNPLANHPTWKYTTCPKCGKPAIRETDTMDTFVDSSWYFMRFVDLDKKNPINKELCNRILPIDQYVGGIEHATMHLMYFRFFTKVMADMGYFNKEIREPAKKLFNQGMVCHKAYRNSKKEWYYPWNVKEENGKYFDIHTSEELVCEGVIKMSKSKCNVVDINTIIENYGADSARLFVLSDTPADKDFEWTTEGIEGSWKYINRVWKIAFTFAEENNIQQLKNIRIDKINNLLTENHKAIKNVTNFLENLEFNKAIARIRELSNAIEKFEAKDEQDLAIKYLAIENLIKMLSPITPHLCEELNLLLQNKEAIDKLKWPILNEKLTVDNEITIVLQVNGKLRAEIKIEKNLAKEKIEELAREQENIKKYLKDQEIKKVIIVPGKLINFVI